MKTNERHIYETLRRVRDFGVTHASDFPADSLGGTLFAAMGTTVTNIESLASTQGSSLSAARQLTQSKILTRETLIAELEAIGLIARGLALDNAGLENKFRPPRNLSDSDLLTLSRSFLADAQPLAAEFVRNGMAAAFPADLKDAIGAFEQAVTERNNRRGSHVSATASIEPALGVGMKQLKQLNGTVRTVYRQNRAMLAAWTSASHIQRPSQKPAAAPPPPPTVAEHQTVAEPTVTA